jgi:hypothetical protein
VSGGGRETTGAQHTAGIQSPITDKNFHSYFQTVKKFRVPGQAEMGGRLIDVRGAQMGTTKTSVRTGARKKNPARSLVNKQANLINKLVNNIEEKIDANELKATLGDLIRLMQMQKELEENQPREIKVTWVETPEAEYEPEA